LLSDIVKINTLDGGKQMTVNRMILNETSYFGKGAIENIVPEIETRGFKKSLWLQIKD